MHPPEGCTIFRSVPPNQAVVALLLVENSKAMSSIWPNIRDKHLPTLIGTMRIANPVAPINILVLTSSLGEDQTPATIRRRQYNEPLSLQFDHHPDNRISATTINRGIELLASTGYGEPVARHIIIIAASIPLEDPNTLNTRDTMYPFSGSAWQSLPTAFAKYDIQCHMILNPRQNMDAFARLFNHTLHIQCMEEVQPWFYVEDDYFLRLSARPGCDLRYGVSGQMPCTSAFGRLDHPQLIRNYSFPPDIRTIRLVDDFPVSPISTSEPKADISTPSLVIRTHGLTKKKVYGTKPARQPFFREDRVREKYRRAPNALTIPSSSADTPTGMLVHRDRLGSRLQFDQPLLAEQVGPTDSFSCQSSCSQRGSRVLSPEIDTSLSPPTSVSKYGAVSPILPMLPDLEQYSPTMSAPVTPSLEQGFAIKPKMEPVSTDPSPSIDPVVGVAERSWLQGQYLPIFPPFSQPSQFPGVLTPAHIDGSVGFKGLSFPRRHTVSLSPYQPLTRPLLSTRTQTVIESSRTINTLGEPTGISLSPFTNASIVGDDAPFIFPEELEDETAAQVEDILPSPSVYQYPVPSPGGNQFPPVPEFQNSYLAAVSPLPLSPSTVSPAGLAYRQNPYPHPYRATPDKSPMSGFYTNVGSSSLTGWAG